MSVVAGNLECPARAGERIFLYGHHYCTLIRLPKAVNELGVVVLREKIIQKPDGFLEQGCELFRMSDSNGKQGSVYSHNCR